MGVDDLLEELENAAHEALKANAEGCLYEGRLPDCAALAEALTPLVKERIAEAEKRGAMAILRYVADRTKRQLATGTPLAKTVEEAMTQAIDGLRGIADRIGRDGMPGEVTR
jgi:hypothetical protein